MALSINAVVTVAELLDPIDRGAHGVKSYRSISQSTAYNRQRPANIDTIDVDKDQKNQVDRYFDVLQQDHSKVGHIILGDSLVVGQGSVITKKGGLIRESAAEFLAHNQVPDGLSKTGDNTFRVNSFEERWIDRPSLLLKRPWYQNYGHWLVDGAALAALAAKLTLPNNWQVVVGVQNSAQMTNVVSDCLKLLLPGVTVVAHPDNEVWRFTELHYVTPVHIPPLFKFPLALSTLQSLIIQRELGKSYRRRRLYVRRRIQNDRTLENESEVLALCRSMNIESVYPEELSFFEQAMLFHNAELVLGVKGAAMTNALFCTATAHVIIMSPSDFSDPFYWDLVAQTGASYSEIFGEVASRTLPTGRNPFHIDVKRLRWILEND